MKLDKEIDLKISSPQPRSSIEEIAREYEADMKRIDALLVDLFHAFDDLAVKSDDGRLMKVWRDEFAAVVAPYRKLKPLIIKAGLYRGNDWSRTR